MTRGETDARVLFAAILGAETSVARGAALHAAARALARAIDDRDAALARTAAAESPAAPDGERVATARVRAMLDYPYVACCGGCGTRLYCSHDIDDSAHGIHGRVQRDVHDLAADLLDAREALAAAGALHLADCRLVATLTGELAAIRDALGLRPEATGEQCAEASRVMSDALRSAVGTVGAQGRLLAEKHTLEDGVSLLVSGVLADATQATNHAEYRGTYLGRRFAVTVQWADGKTPGELITNAEGERDAAVAQRAALAGAVRAYHAAVDTLMLADVAYRSEVDHDHEGAVTERLRAGQQAIAARAALDAALAGCV